MKQRVNTTVNTRVNTRLNAPFTLLKPLSVSDDVETRSRHYVLVLWVAFLATAAALVMVGQPLGNPYVVALLAVVAAISERMRVQLSANLSESISLVPILFAAVLFGPLAAMLVATASFLPEFRPPYLRWGSYTASRALTAAVTGGVALLDRVGCLQQACSGSGRHAHRCVCLPVHGRRIRCRGAQTSAAGICRGDAPRACAACSCGSPLVRTCGRISCFRIPGSVPVHPSAFLRSGTRGPTTFRPVSASASPHEPTG